MPLESAGLGDKLGNRYEGRWVAKQLLALLNEEIQSVIIEAIGDDEQGVDLWVENKQGIRQAQQCKARNASEEYWRMGDLNAKGILKYLQSQLDRDPEVQYALVSSVGSETFKDICDRARRSDNNSKLFHQYKIVDAGKDVNTCFNNFCKSLTLNPENSKDLNKAFGYLQRTYVTLFPDDRNTWDELRGRAGYLLTGDPESNIALLISYAENNDKFGSQIYADELRNHLADHKIYPKRLAHDKRIVPVINELQTQFFDSIRLINNKPLQRSETDRLIEAVRENRNVILHGAAGFGKSGVLYELLKYLRKNNIPSLPIRLDRREPENTAAQFGENLGLPDCPVYCLAAQAGDRPSFLILDQLDALRWTSSHTNNALDVCKELLRHAQSLRLSGKKITVVLSCRTFDLEHDPEIRNWLSGQTNKEFEKIEVKELSREILRKIIGSPHSSLTDKELKILTSPQNLSMWLEIRETDNTAFFSSATELIRRFWGNRRRVLEQAGIHSEQLDTVLGPLIDYMERQGKISAPKRVAGTAPKVLDALKSYGVLQEDASRISFCHQQYLDFLIADRLLCEIDQGTGNITVWLGSREKQSLFRREQLRQALVMLSEESPDEFLAEAESILNADSIRFHIKHLVLELIGIQDVVNEDLYSFCLRLFRGDLYQEHVFGTVFWAHAPYVQLLVKKGIITEWLNSDDQDKLQQALGLLRSVADKLPDIAAEILEPYVEFGGEWPARIFDTLPWKITDDSEHMFLLRLQLLRMGYQTDFIDWKSICAEYPLRSIQLIEAVLSCWTVNDAKKQIKSYQQCRHEKWHEHERKALNDAVSEYPEETWGRLIPHIDRLTCFDNEPSFIRWTRKWYNTGRQYTDIARGVVELVMLAGQRMTINNPDEFVEKTALLKNGPSPVIQEILMKVYAQLPPSHAEVGIRWLLEDLSRFSMGLGYAEPEWQPAARLIKSLSPHCSDELFQRLEHAIVHYHAPDEKRSAEYYLPRRRKGYFPHYWGKAQHFLLPALDQAEIKASTAALIRVLKRKFAMYTKKDFLRGGYTSGGTVGSRLDPNLERISDRAWLEIVVSKKVTQGGLHDWVQYKPNVVLETSVEQFSRSLNAIACRYPERFGRLILRFPDYVPSSYVSAVIDVYITG